MAQATVVLRSSGERTADHARQLAELQVGPENVVVVRECPFTAAVAKTFEVGLDRGHRWTMALDADVLLATGAVRRLLEIAEAQSSDVFEVQGRIMDKLFCVPKPGGPHLYRTSMLDRARHLVPPPQASVRPESFVFHTMARMGFQHVHFDEVFGIHDYEQYYRDVYRKAYVHGIKFKKFAPYLRRVWDRRRASDADYRVASEAFHEGIKRNGAMVLDAEALRRLADESSFIRNLSEKPDLEGAPSPAEVQQIIDAYEPSPIDKRFESELNPAGRMRLGRGLTPWLRVKQKAGNKLIGWGTQLRDRAMAQSWESDD